MSEIMISTTAEERGKGRDRFKYVVGLTEKEQEHVKEGGLVLFHLDSRPKGAKRGKERWAVWVRGRAGLGWVDEVFRLGWRKVIWIQDQFRPQVPKDIELIKAGLESAQ